MRAGLNALLQGFEKYSTFFIGILMGMILLLGLELSLLEYKRPLPKGQVMPIKTVSTQVVTVDVTGLANNYINELAKSTLTPEESKAAIADFSARLSSAIRAISTDEHVIVLPSQAVLAGAKDETPVVVELMKSVKD